MTARGTWGKFSAARKASENEGKVEEWREREREQKPSAKNCSRSRMESRLTEKRRVKGRRKQPAAEAAKGD